MIFIQPYMSWQGHYKIYSESLLKNKSDFLICFKDKILPNKKNIIFKTIHKKI